MPVHLKEAVSWHTCAIATQNGYSATSTQILDNDQLDTHLLYFTIRLLWSFTCSEHYMLIIRRLNYIDAASGIITLSQWPSGAQVEKEFSLNLCTGRSLTESDDTRCCINTIHPPDYEHIKLETCRGL